MATAAIPAVVHNSSAAVQLIAAPQLPPIQTVTTELNSDAYKPVGSVSAEAGPSHPTHPAHPMTQQGIGPLDMHPHAGLTAGHLGDAAAAHNRLLMLPQGHGMLHQHHLLGAQQPGSPQVLLIPQRHWNDLAVMQQHQQQMLLMQQQQGSFVLTHESLYDNFIPNIDPAQLVSSHEAGTHPMTAAAAAAAFGSTVGLDMLVEPTANLEVAAAMMTGATVDVTMHEADVAGQGEDDEGFINLLDGSAPEGLYQVTRARAEAAVPLETAQGTIGDASKR